jgi:alpha-beta hydrolase superfamily lysophospholipase
MQEKEFRFVSVDGPNIFVRQWLPDGAGVKATVLIAHGAAEHSGRYKRAAAMLTTHGFAVLAPDHRGHGQTAGSLANAGDAGLDGFNGMIRDLSQLADIVRENQPQAGIFLLGHSMGAALAQRFIQLHGGRLRGAILSGSPGLRPNVEQAAAGTAKIAAAAPEQVSTLFQQAFASYNQGFEPIVTGFEWLSRDAAEVKKYADDPWCGFPFSNRLVAQMSHCAWEAASIEHVANIPKSLPILLFSGTHDRVGGNGEFVKQLAELYRQAGIADVQAILYPEGRHEMLNEVNRDEVQRDLLSWLQRHT